MPPSNPQYKYTKLKTLKPHIKADVYGVVKFFKPPYKTKGSDYCTMVSIMDESYSDPMEKLKCLLFNRDVNNLPPVKLGQIVRFHRLSVTEFNGNLQGQNSAGFSWVLFSGEPGASLEPLKASSTNYTITDTDKKTVQELRQWATGYDELREKLSRFNDVAVGCYFDLICQVVYTSVIEDGVTRLFKVWDGTSCIYPCREVSSESQELNIQKDERLVKAAQGFIYEICVFDDHFGPSGPIKPGNFIKFTNLHAAEFKSGRKDDGYSTIEFVLHRGNAFGRGVCIVESDGSELSELKQRLEIIALQNESYDCSDINSQEQVSSSMSSSNTGMTVVPSSHRVQANESEIIASDPVPSTSHVAAELPSSTTQNLLPYKSAVPDVISDDRTLEPVPSTSRVPACVATDLDSELVSVSGKDNRIKDGMTNRIHPYDDKHRNETEKKPCTLNTKLMKSSVELSVDELRKIKPIRDTHSGCIQGGQKIPDSVEASSLPRCMIQTSTVVLNHPHIERTKIDALLDHSVPYKFCIRAKVYDYYPKLSDVKKFLKLYCSTCHYLCSYPGVDSNENCSLKLQIGSTFNGVPHFNCPRCFENKDSLEALDSPPHLKYTYMMRFLLGDDTGMLMANLWMDDAVTFFQDLEPEFLLANEGAFEQIRELMTKICPDDTTVEEKLLIECCIKSYCVSEGTGYQIFDTCIV